MKGHQIIGAGARWVFLWVFACLATHVVAQPGRCLGGNCHTGSGKWQGFDGAEYEGQFRGGKFHGVGVQRLPGGNVYEGHFVAGRREGHGTFVWTSGDTYIGDWHRDGMVGHGVMISADGRRYEGEFKWGSFQGRGVFAWPTGERYEGEWFAGLPHGDGTFTWPFGARFAGEWRVGRPDGHGYATLADPSGQLAPQARRGIWRQGGMGHLLQPLVWNGDTIGYAQVEDGPQTQASQGVLWFSERRRLSIADTAVAMRFTGYFSAGALGPGGTFRWLALPTADNDELVSLATTQAPNQQEIEFASGKKIICQPNGLRPERVVHHPVVVRFGNGDRFEGHVAYVGPNQALAYHGTGTYRFSAGPVLTAEWRVNVPVGGYRLWGADNESPDSQHWQWLRSVILPPALLPLHARRLDALPANPAGLPLRYLALPPIPPTR